MVLTDCAFVLLGCFRTPIRSPSVPLTPYGVHGGLRFTHYFSDGHRPRHLLGEEGSDRCDHPRPAASHGYHFRLCPPSIAFLCKTVCLPKRTGKHRTPSDRSGTLLCYDTTRVNQLEQPMVSVSILEALWQQTEQLSSVVNYCRFKSPLLTSTWSPSTAGWSCASS